MGFDRGGKFNFVSGGKAVFKTGAGEIGGKLTVAIGGKVAFATGTAVEMGGKVFFGTSEIAGLERGGKVVFGAAVVFERGGRATVAEGGGGRGDLAVIAIVGNLPAEIGGKGVRGISFPLSSISVFIFPGEVKGILIWAGDPIVELSGRGDIGINGAAFII